MFHPTETRPTKPVAYIQKFELLSENIQKLRTQTSNYATHHLTHYLLFYKSTQFQLNPTRPMTYFDTSGIKSDAIIFRRFHNISKYLGAISDAMVPISRICVKCQVGFGSQSTLYILDHVGCFAFTTWCRIQAFMVTF